MKKNSKMDCKSINKRKMIVIFVMLCFFTGVAIGTMVAVNEKHDESAITEINS